MAGERTGKTYEAIIKVALQSLRDKEYLFGNIYWNETPEGITVEPDFLIGPDKDHPELVFMVTHFGASSASHKKVWRNIGELCELKTHFGEILAFNIIFDSNLKDSLKELQNKVFDGQLIVGDTQYGVSLRSFIDSVNSSLPTDQNEKVIAIQNMRTSNKSLDIAMQYLEDDLLSCIKKSETEPNTLWNLENRRSINRAPSCKNTYVRRGCCKLTIFENIENAIELYSGVRVCSVPDYIYLMGFAKKAIGHVEPCDEEAKQAVQLLDKNTIINIVNSMSKNELYNGWINQIRNSSNIEFMWEYVKNEYHSLCDPTTLYERLLELHSNPDALVRKQSETSNWPPNNVWLFEIIMEIIKSESGLANGFGYSQLAVEISINEHLKKIHSENITQFLLSPWGHLSDWSSRNPRCVVPNDVIHCIACILSTHLQEMGISRLEQTHDTITRDYINSLFETRICVYRDFDPLKVILDHAFPEASLIKYRTCFAEAAGLGGQTGKTTVIKVHNTIINWQTATDAGKDHKRKELCGRAVGLRYTWDSNDKCFAPRPNVEKLILLLDGTWTQRDLNALVNAGWDEIYYPDEIDKLKAAIV